MTTTKCSVIDSYGYRLIPSFPSPLKGEGRVRVNFAQSPSPPLSLTHCILEEQWVPRAREV
jgi:hypothetical protein